MGPCEKKLTGVVNITVRMSLNSTAVKYRLELMAHFFSGISRPSPDRPPDRYPDLAICGSHINMRELINFPQVHDDTPRSPRSNWLQPTGYREQPAS